MLMQPKSEHADYTEKLTHRAMPMVIVKYFSIRPIVLLPSQVCDGYSPGKNGLSFTLVVPKPIY